MSWLDATALAVGTVLLILYLRIQQKEIATLLGICASLILFSTGVTHAGELIEVLTEIAREGDVDEVVQLLLRGLGISLVGQLCADLCRATGEGFVASQIEWISRIELLILCLQPTTALLRWVWEVLG